MPETKDFTEIFNAWIRSLMIILEKQSLFINIILSNDETFKISRTYQNKIFLTFPILWLFD